MRCLPRREVTSLVVKVPGRTQKQSDRARPTLRTSSQPLKTMTKSNTFQRSWKYCQGRRPAAQTRITTSAVKTTRAPKSIMLIARSFPTCIVGFMGVMSRDAKFERPLVLACQQGL